MNAKHSHQHAPSSSQKKDHKSRHQTASPQNQLLQTKKKNNTSQYNSNNPHTTSTHNKKSRSFVSSVFGHASKPSKSPSNEKKRTSASMSGKRKRNKTEHERQSTIDHNRDNKISRSLYYDMQRAHDPARHLEQSTINKRNKNLRENTRLDSQNLHHRFGVDFQKLQIKDVDALISLIDACVREANDYIAYLSDKLSLLKNQLAYAKVDRIQLKKQIDIGVEALKKNQLELEQKNKVLRHLQGQLEMIEKRKGKNQNSFQIKSLIQTIDRISQQNERLRAQNTQLKSTFEGTIDPQEMNQEQMLDYYNSMHKKFDTLNVQLRDNPGLNKGKLHQNRKVKESGKVYKQFDSHIEN